MAPLARSREWDDDVDGEVCDYDLIYIPLHEPTDSASDSVFFLGGACYLLTSTDQWGGHWHSACMAIH